MKTWNVKYEADPNDAYHTTGVSVFEEDYEDWFGDPPSLTPLDAVLSHIESHERVIADTKHDLGLLYELKKKLENPSPPTSRAAHQQVGRCLERGEKIEVGDFFIGNEGNPGLYQVTQSPDYSIHWNTCYMPHFRPLENKT